MIKQSNNNLKTNPNSPLEKAILISFPILFSLTTLSAIFLLNSRSEASAETTQSATASVNVPSACTLTSSGEGSHTATSIPGVFTENIGTTTITTTCNNHPGGYAIYAIGYSDSTYGNTNLINSTDTSTTIPTGTGTAGSNWSMKLAAGTGTESTDIVAAYRDYTNVPSTFTKVVNKNSATTPTTGSTVTTTYGTYVTPTQRPGTYNGKVKYIMTNPSTSEITFYMQDVDQIKAELANAAVGTELKVVDKRDNKTYTVAKMADGNIWMNQNLDLELDSNKTYTSADTDIKADWNPSASTTTTTTWSRDSSYINLPQSYDPGDLCWKGTPSTSNYGSLSQYAQACSTAGSNKHYHVGNYYDWTAAVAMNDSSSHTAQNDDVNQSICPAGWMLPKSGTTQTGSGSFQYLVNQQGLTSGTSGNIHQTPVYFVYGGYWGGISYDVSYDGYYWSSVVRSSSDANFLYFDATGYLNPHSTSTRFARNYGRSVRCLAR